MALPNGDLITTVFDPQMAYPVDKRMQVDTLNSRDSMSMFIRWEGMEVYVLENNTKYILQGGRSNEFWKESGTGTGTGGTTFVGQFATADLLPTSGRSAGDYAFVGTGDDFVQYNWDNIANEWVMAEGQTDMASEFFHIGYKTPLRRPVIFPLFPKDVLVETSGDFVFAPETAVARFIFVGEVEAIRGIETAAADREIKLVNRTGSDITLRDKASGIPSGSGFDFGGTDYTWVNGSEITLKGNGTYWEIAPNNQIAFSDHLHSVNAQVSVGSDGLKVWTGFIDSITKVPVNFKQLDYIPSVVDGRIFMQINGEYYGDAEFLETRIFNVAKFGADPTGTNFSDIALDRIRILMTDGDKIAFPLGEYKFQNTQTFSKSVEIDFGNSTIYCSGGDGFVFTGTEKLTTTVTSNYIESTSKNSLQLASVSGIEIGDLINIVSTELFNDERTSYVKGGNFLITKIEGNTVYFDRTMPFDISAESIEVKVFNAPEIELYNVGLLENSNALSTAQYGIRFYACKKSLLSFSKTNKFQYNIDIYRCVDFTLNDIYTGNAKNSNSDNWDGYGVAIESSSRVTCNRIKTNSGQHGITNGGREVSYDLVFNDCTMKSEIWSLGFGAHADVYNMTFNDCTIFGINLSGNCVLNRSKILSSELTTHSNVLNGGLSSRYANFTFNECEINGDLFSYGYTTDKNSKYIGSVIFNNCHGFKIRMMGQSRLAGGPYNQVNLTNLSLNNCTNFKIDNSDYISSIHINDCEINSTNQWFYDGLPVAGFSGTVGDLVVNNLKVKIQSGPYLFRAVNTQRVIINNLMKMDGSSTSGTVPFVITNVSELILNNADLSGWTNNPSYSNLQKVKFTNSKLGFTNQTQFRTFLNAVPEVELDNFTFTLDNSKYNVKTYGSIKYRFDGIDIYYPVGTSNTWSLINRDRVRQPVGGTNITLTFDHALTDLAFTGSAGNITIPPDVFIPGVARQQLSIEGEIEGGAKTFVAGTGVTLRYPDGQGLTAPTGSRFIVKFKSPNDALVTIIKPYASVSTFNELTDTPASKTGNKNKTVKVSNDETTHVYVADGVDVRNITDGGSIAPTLTDGFIGSRLNFTSSTAVTLQGFTSAGGQSSVTLVNPHSTNNLTLVHNGAGTVKYIDAGATDLVIAPKTAVKVEIVGDEIYRVL